jgi:polysaccharide biosynthesis protein PelF
MKSETVADVCLILEGTYPYVSGGVSMWTHHLLLAQSHLSFQLVCLVPERAEPTVRYQVPSNVAGITDVRVGALPAGDARLRGAKALFERLERPLLKLQADGGLAELGEVMNELRPFGGRLGRRALLNSPEAWELILRMYHATHPDSAFLDYFWSWRAILGGIYSMLLAPLPSARVYHTVSTGYAGLYASRAHLETGRPALLTEHGIYTNERHIEIAMADWLYQPEGGLTLEKSPRDLRILWFRAFAAYSRACYQAASRIITLHTANQYFQIADGAPPEKLEIIPNGIDYRHFSLLQEKREEHPPAIALIGRVVPIKDVKTFIRAAAIVRAIVPDVQALVLGPADEDPEYFAECQALVSHLGLESCLQFTGPVSVPDYLPRLDVVVLTSISEAQPLVILEAGAAGVPSVATDVGACREMIHGSPNEEPPLGAGGEVTPLANPTATAQAIAGLLLDLDRWQRSSRAMRERVRRYYDKPGLDRSYRELYEHWRAAPGQLRASPVSGKDAA